MTPLALALLKDLFIMKHRMLPLAAISLIALILPGCAVHARPATVEVTGAPVVVDTYPAEYYDGHRVYYYGDRWYYRDGAAWRYYRQEPPELYRRRPYVQSAPPAYRAPGYAPPAYRNHPRGPVAPPAVRR